MNMYHASNSHHGHLIIAYENFFLNKIFTGNLSGKKVYLLKCILSCL